MNTAVIGGGMAGWRPPALLSRQHGVTLFERHAQPGFAVVSLTVPATTPPPSPVKMGDRTSAIATCAGPAPPMAMCCRARFERSLVDAASLRAAAG
jgi:hypothetical protein